VRFAARVLGFARSMMPGLPYVPSPTAPSRPTRHSSTTSSVIGSSTSTVTTTSSSGVTRTSALPIPSAPPNRHLAAVAARGSRTKRSLGAVLRERGPLPLAHAVELALDVCDALSVAHSNGVVHGQLGLGCVRLALAADGAPRDVEIFTLDGDRDSTADGEGADSLSAPVAPFLEPERAGGIRRVDTRSDIWALGALLYTTLVGTAPPAPPARDATPSGSPTAELPLENAPRSLAAVIEACLSRDPESRPNSVDDIAERIASFATWPPDQFARIGARREKREAAERVRLQLERRGLGNLPSVLDKLDDAALARAQRPATASLSSLLHQNVRQSTEQAMQRLMTAVHEGTDEARVELAARLPSLVDFDDEDEESLPFEDDHGDDLASFERGAHGAPVASPLTAIPVALDEPLLSAAPPPHADPAPSGSRARSRTVITATCAVLAIILGAGSLGYALSARASTSVSDPDRASRVSATAADPPTPVAATAAATASSPAIPVLAASALPEAPAITPASLPEATP
jgi:hypothetical protein